MEDTNEKLPDYYEILGIAVSSTSNEIKKAYHRIARDNHPDRNQGDVELFKRAALAYEFLSDTDKRRGYDSQLRRSRTVKVWEQSRKSFNDPHFSTPTSPLKESFTAAAAATTAFNHFSTESFDSEREYTRRPRETKFSKRESPRKENPDADRTSTLSDQLQDRPDLSHPNESENRPNTKRKTDNETSKGSPKRRRVFDMDELRQVPPFTQKHGTSFKFHTMSGALPHVSPKRKKTNAPPRDDESAFQENDDDKYEVAKLLQLYTESSVPVLNNLATLHHERVNGDLQSIQAVHESFLKTKLLLEDILTGTNNALQALHYI